MSGLEVLAVIGVVVPALAKSVELVQSVRARKKKKKKDQDEVAAYLMSRLESSLMEGQFELRNAFAHYAGYYGEAFKVGDLESQRQMQRHAQEAENIRELHRLAITLNREMDPKREQLEKLYKSVNGVCRDTKQTMEDLSERLSLRMSMCASSPAGSGSRPSLTEQKQSPSRQTTMDSRQDTLIGSSAAAPGTQMEAFWTSMDAGGGLFAATPTSASPIGSVRSSVSENLAQTTLSNVPSTSPQRVQTTSTYLERPSFPSGHSRQDSSLSISTTSSLTSANRSTPPSSPDSRRQSQLMLAGKSIQGSTHLPRLLGRPEGANKYFGLCRGAWTIQNDAKGQKGLELRVVPIGYCGHRNVWQCKECEFVGDVCGTGKKDRRIETKVRTATCGIQYRWIFLAWSHRKCKEPPGLLLPAGQSRAQTYGCVFCCAERRPSDTFGDHETLLNHIMQYHSANISADVRLQYGCVVGESIASDPSLAIGIPLVSEAANGPSTAVANGVELPLLENFDASLRLDVPTVSG